MNTYERIIKKLLDKKIIYEEIDQTAAKDSSIEALLIATPGITFQDCLATLFFRNENGEYIVILKRADRNLKSSAIKKLTNSKSLNFIDEVELNKFGFEAGLASPALLEEIQAGVKMTVLVDQKVIENERVICGIGKEGYALRIAVTEVLKLVGKHIVADMTEPNPKRQPQIGRPVILTGDTPSGKLHLGHYVGTLENRVKMQNDYDTYILLANVHAYANYYDQSEKINESVYNVFLDNLAAGIDPDKSTIYLESGIPETFEFYSFFLTMVKNARAMRNPSVKDEIRYKKLDPSLAFVAYPILQAADILQFNANVVPVGEDQLPVIEQSREIARDFNKAYGEMFVLPEGKVGRVARLVGTDGKEKMSKSGHNAILLSDDEATLREKVASMYTDPNRIRVTDPGTVEGNPVFIFHDAFNQNVDEVADLKARYQLGKVSDKEVKEKLFIALNQFLMPIREKRLYYENNPKLAKEILIEGTKKARAVVQKNLEKFKALSGIDKLITA